MTTFDMLMTAALIAAVAAIMAVYSTYLSSYTYDSEQNFAISSRIYHLSDLATL